MQALLLQLALAAQLTAAPAAESGLNITAAEPEPAAPFSSTVVGAAVSQPDPAAVAAAASAPAAAPLAVPSAAAPLPAAAPSTAAAPPAAVTPPVADLPQHSVLAAAPKPSDLMRQLMNTPTESQLAGTPLTLGDAVRAARTRQDQTARAKAYWNLSAAVGDYYLALLENSELNVLRQSLLAPSDAWNVRQREASTRVDAAYRAAVGAQWQLHHLLGGPPTALLPLPADMPHCGRYSAEYEEIFAARPNPFARELSELLPLRHEELRNQAQAVLDAAARRDDLTRRRDPASGGDELLAAEDLLALKRRAFLTTARDYNQEIAAYTELAAPAEVAPDRLVAMMIRASAPADRLPWQSSGVRQAMATEAAPPAAQAAPAADPAQPATFAPESYREVRRPLQRLLDSDREHSIVSRIRKLRDRMIE